MRLSHNEIQAIIGTFHECFLETDTIFLFGSRIDDKKRGGDIDLFIETYEIDSKKRLQRKLQFLTKLQKKIGEQKIDVVIRPHNAKENLPIYEHAKTTGIKLQ